MMFEIPPGVIKTLIPELTNIYIALFGGLVLFFIKASEHFNRKEQDKLSATKYFVFFTSLLLGLPILGAAVTSIYILNGDKISPILALQVGLTSPAIVQSLIIAAANNMVKQSEPVLAPNQ